MIKHCGPISGIATYGGNLVATAGYDNNLILWDATTKKSLAKGVHDHLTNQATFSPDGKYLLSSSSDYTSRLWTVPDLKLVAVLAEHDDDVEMSTFHPTKQLIATASRDHRVRVYDFTGALVQEFHGHEADVISVEWDRERDEVISSSDDGTIKRWSLQTGTMVHEIDMDGIETDTIAISSDGTIYAGNDNGEIIRIRLDESTAYPAHAAGIKRLVYEAQTGRLVSLSYDRTLMVWDTTGDELVPLKGSALPAQVWPRSCAFLDTDTLAFATFGSTYATWDMSADTWSLDGVEGTRCINAVTSFNGRLWTIGDAGILQVAGTDHTDVGSLCNFLTVVGDRVVTGGQMGTVFDADTGAVIYQHHSPLNCGAAFERDGMPHVVIGAYTGEGIVLRLNQDRFEVVQITPLHANAIKGVATSEGVIFSVCADGAAAWHSCQTLEKLAYLQAAHDRIANGCAAMPGGRFASISRDLKLRIWKDQTAQVIDTPFDHSIKCVAASSDGRYIAAGAYNGLTGVYDTEQNDWTTIYRATTAGVSCMYYDSEADVFRAASYDGNVYTLQAGRP